MKRAFLLLLVAFAFVTIMSIDHVEAVPEFDLDYVVYNVTSKDNGTELRVYHHTMESDDEVVQLLEPLIGPIANIRPDWTCVRNTTATISFWARIKDPSEPSEWSPCSYATMAFTILDGHDETFTRPPAKYHNGTDCVFEAGTEGDGYGEFDLMLPSSLANHQLFPACIYPVNGTGLVFVQGTDWNFTVAPPQTIRIDESTEIYFPSSSTIGFSGVIISGYVRYIYTNGGVQGANMTVTVNGNLSSYVTTDNDGRFTVVLVDSLPEFGRVFIEIKAVDTRSNENDSIDFEFFIPGPDGDPVEDQNNFWFWVTFYAILISGLVIAVHMVQTAVMDQGREEEEGSDD